MSKTTTTKRMSNAEFKAMVNKKMGEGTIFSLEKEGEVVKVEPISTGIPSLDYALGIGGLPKGRIIEIYGPESSGKTTISLKVIAAFQASTKYIPERQGLKTLFYDQEHALDPVHAKALGVDISEETGMMVLQSNTGEEMYDSVLAMIQTGEIGLVVIDSVPSILPKAVIEASAEDNHMAVAARLNGKMVPQIAKAAQEHGVLVIFINQIRGTMAMYGSPTDTPGGKAFKFYSSVRISVSRKEIKKGEVFLGQTIKCDIKKNKVARPFTKAEFDYYWDTGVDVQKDIMNVAMDMDIIKRAGAWYYLGEDSKNPSVDGAGNALKWQGKEMVEAVLKQSPELYDYIYKIVLGIIPRDAQFVTVNDEDGVGVDDDAFEGQQNMLEEA